MMNHAQGPVTDIKRANRDTFDFTLRVYKKTAWKSLSIALFLDWQKKAWSSWQHFGRATRDVFQRVFQHPSMQQHDKTTCSLSSTLPQLTEKNSMISRCTYLPFKIKKNKNRNSLFFSLVLT